MQKQKCKRDHNILQYYQILPSLYWKPQFSRWSEMGVSRIRKLEGSYQSLQLERFPV